jgi:DMSO reductase iron-sulfur subunit
MPLSFVFDQKKCTGCQACQLACIIENQLDPAGSWRRIYTFNERHYPGAPLFHLSLACNHCGDPACMSACPARAYSKDRATGIVSVDSEKCIGCRYCTWACPYDAPKFATHTGVVSKCTLCSNRLDRGLQPACADLCPTGALAFEDLEEAAITNDVAGFTASTLRPSIKIIPFPDGRLAATQATPDRAALQAVRQERPASKITLRGEWPLALFTLVASFLVALFGATATAGQSVSPVLFVLPAIAAMIIGGAHLGRKGRAWRIVLNIANSWLSREIVLFSLFALAAVAYMWLGPFGAAVAWALTVLGFATLLAIDMVYEYALRPAPGLPHSASTFLTGLLLAGVLASHPALAGAAGASKFVLYAWRKTGMARGRESVRILVSSIRLLLGLVLPTAVWIAGFGDWWLLITLVLAGEVIDRCEFYVELEFMTPALQMTVD